jgi:hypothetical protein
MKRPEVLTVAAATTITTTKIENATAGLPTNCFNRLHNRVLCAGAKAKGKGKGKGKENAMAISRVNPSDNYRKTVIMLLWFS